MGKGLVLDKALVIAGMSKSSYYYCQVKGKPGAKPSVFTRLVSPSGESSEPDDKVVERIRDMLSEEFVDYGYHKVCGQLQLEGFLINHKKTYRLMRENKLLNPKSLRKGLPRNFVKYRVVKPTRPLEILEMDIKYAYVAGLGRNAFVLTILDTFTRMVLGWKVGFSMTRMEVKALWEAVIEEHLQGADLLVRGLKVTVRSDNGAQFLAQTVREFLADNHLLQENTHPYTPQENGHIESFHAILAKALDGWEFDDLMHLEKTLKDFYYFYNEKRIHSSICFLPPRIFWEAFENGLVQVLQEKRNMKYRLLEKRQYLLRELTFRQCEPEGVCA